MTLVQLGKILEPKIVIIYITHQLKHILWVLKTTVSIRRQSQ